MSTRKHIPGCVCPYCDPNSKLNKAERAKAAKGGAKGKAGRPIADGRAVRTSQDKTMTQPMQERKLIGRVTTPANDDTAPRRQRCGAYSRRSGKPCLNWAMPNGRCRMHGGMNNSSNRGHKTPTGNKLNLTHGIYSEGILDDELDLYFNMVQEIGTLDNEIHMARLVLRRCHKAQKHWEQVRGLLAEAEDYDTAIAIATEHRLLQIDEIEYQGGTMCVGRGDDQRMEDIYRTRLKRKIHDFSVEIHKYTTLIAKLEGQRKELLATGDFGGDFVRKLAEDLRGFGEQAMGLMPGGEQLGMGEASND